MSMQYAGHDTSLAGGFTLRTSLGTVKFQFPPKVQGDNRSANWSEQADRGREPYAVFETTSPKVYTILITYICDGGQWDAGTITQQLHNMRGYYLNPQTADDTWYVAYLKCWAIGGNDEMTCRLKSTDVKYSDTLVGQGDSAFPLRTDVTLDIRLWTKGGPESIQNVQNLKGDITPDWY